MAYETSTPPDGYEWAVEEVDDPLFGHLNGKTLALVLKKDGKQVERRGVFVPAKRENETEAFIRGMEESIRMAL
ncbi:hypothetical protein SEA_DAUBENSKI_200 [Streptomyces phage Daubenski]|uniref:Uncharacterized protein n=1 Tax=Streptomyces phage Daubenski TaxID=2653725 RepID=A0A5Q2WIG5_9CAUD|nr:hypothetical protein KNU80_gp103 [Streptomyces phage Daubenski]QGH76469.1 hypothetical protein SEA_DAUBENSKI_200 [Streptomyces phage Daubenski]